MSKISVQKTKQLVNTIVELQGLWNENHVEYKIMASSRGIRSTQIICFIDYLIKKGVLNDDT